MLQKSQQFDFIETMALGRTLFVGEGNLSFSLALAQHSQVTANRFITSVYEDRHDLTEATINNVERLKSLKAAIPV